MKKLKTIKRIITASLAVIITLTVFAAAPASASQLKSEATYGFISENKDFYEAHKDAMDHTASELLNMNPHVDISEYDLSEDEINQIVDLMVNVKALGLDYNTLLDQASDIYAKFGDKLTADDLGTIAAQGAVGAIKDKIGSAFKGVYDGVKGFFTRLFKK